MRGHIGGIVGPGATAVAVALALICGATPRADGVALAASGERMCGAGAGCAQFPATPGPDLGDQTTAEQRIIDGYVTKQRACTPEEAPSPSGVAWDAPGFVPNVGGTGMINDANPGLGGPFRADWVNGRWHIEYRYC
jgi:hypothetical protein